MGLLVICPTCGQPTTREAEVVIEAKIATRPDSGPALVRHIGRLERELARLRQSEKRGKTK